MIKLGIIGTGWISDQFIEACAKTGMYQLTTVYSRTLQKAEEFGKKYLADGEYFDDLEKELVPPEHTPADRKRFIKYLEKEIEVVNK